MGKFVMRKKSHKCEAIKEDGEQQNQQDNQDKAPIATQTPEQAALSTQISNIEKQISDLERETATKKSSLENQLVQLKEKYRAAGGGV